MQKNNCINLTAKGEVKNEDMSAFFINYLIAKNVFDENTFEYEFGDKSKLSSHPNHVDASKSISVVKETLNPKNIKIAQKEALMWGTHQQESIEYGNVIHEILSFVKTKNDVDLAVSKAIENGLINAEQRNIVNDTIDKIVNHPVLEMFFAEGNQVLNEQIIIRKEGAVVKPDRMVVSKEGVVFLLDYKTGVYNAKYKKQLEEYEVAIELMGFKVEKKTLVYIAEEIQVVQV